VGGGCLVTKDAVEECSKTDTSSGKAHLHNGPVGIVVLSSKRHVSRGGTEVVHVVEDELEGLIGPSGDGSLSAPSG